jgi:ribosomal protein S18 acetylase RimI-like enzyme
MTRTFNTSLGTIQVGTAAHEDAVHLRELRVEALTTCPTAFTADIRMAQAETAGDWVKRMQNLEQDDRGAIFLARSGEQPLGMAGMIRGERPKTRHNGTIWGVFVRSDWRGLHIAEALVQEAVDWAAAHEVKVVKLGVNASNAAAIRCYIRCGFSVYGVDPKAVVYEGVYYDELLMVKQA